MKRIGAVTIILFMIAIPTCADEFSNVVKNIQSHFGIRPSHQGLSELALLLGKSGIGETGINGLKVAVFENENKSAIPSMQEMDRLMAKSLGVEWQPFVRVSSRRSGECTVVYANLSDRQAGLLIASIERDEIAVVHLKLDAKTIQRWISNPAREAQDARPID
jgi:hypothetical protein